MSGRMQDKVVVVTGAAQGIGRGCAELLAREGARVVIGDLQKEQGAATAAAINAGGGTAIFQQTDVVARERLSSVNRRRDHKLWPYRWPGQQRRLLSTRDTGRNHDRPLGSKCLT